MAGRKHTSNHPYFILNKYGLRIDDGWITFKQRIKDPNNIKPNPQFDVRELRVEIEAYIATLPETQYHMMVIKYGKPYTSESFRQTIPRCYRSADRCGFLRTKSVEDNEGFIRGCIESDYRGHKIH
jgi:hypothetical protein